MTKVFSTFGGAEDGALSGPWKGAMLGLGEQSLSSDGQALPPKGSAKSLPPRTQALSFLLVLSYYQWRKKSHISKALWRQVYFRVRLRIRYPWSVSSQKLLSALQRW